MTAWLILTEAVFLLLALLAIGMLAAWEQEPGRVSPIRWWRL